MPLDNNVCERAIKNVVLGRKSWVSDKRAPY
ncbi:transposase [Salmonella enterica]|nr:transposase [Salmonella enterica]ELV0714589.1 transposase [Salmonella enterica]